MRDNLTKSRDYKNSPSPAPSTSSIDGPTFKKMKKIKAKEPENYVVEKILAINEIDAESHYEIKWKNYPHSVNTWEPMANLVGCQNLLNQYLTAETEIRQSDIDKIVSEMLEASTVLSDDEGFSQLKDFDSMPCRADLILLAIMQENDEQCEESYKTISDRVKENIMILPFWKRRIKQLNDLEQWQNEINKSDKSSQITVENDVDFETSPSTFQYINDNIPGEGVVIPDEPLIGCDCTNGCSIKSNCCGKENGSGYAYNSSKSIRLPQGNGIFECNKLCKCGPDCTNRVVQQGRKHSLTIFKTSNGRGWGVRTDRAIKNGQFICEYVGEVITNKEANLRGQIYDAEKRTYLFDLDCNSIVENQENVYTIDAYRMGNVSRMINHSCDPNIGIWSVWINCLDLDLPKLCFFALRRIEAGEELCFDYINFSGATLDDDNASNVKTNSECKCESKKCRKFIFAAT